jgi:hypothetical protein
MKPLRLLLLSLLLALSLVFRPDPRGPSAAGPGPAPKDDFRAAAHETPTSTITPPAHSAPRARPPADLLEARVAYGCGTCLLARARETEGPLAGALLELAVQQFRACLSHEAEAGPAPLFADARAALDRTRALQARAGRPETGEARPEAAAKEPGVAPHPPEKLTPREPPQEKARVEEPARPEMLPPPAAGAPVVEPVMVGPDGVIYHRAPPR